MKTTIEIADDLLDQARTLARAQGRTLRSVVEEGLRTVLAKPTKESRQTFEMVTYGDPDNRVDPEELERALREAREGRRFPELSDDPYEE